MAIPVFIAAFFHDIGLAKYFHDDLEFIPTITPCDKRLDNCVLIMHEYVSFKIAFLL